MIKIGEIQELKVQKQVSFGVFLADPGNEEEKVLLPASQVPEGIRRGDTVQVFVYRDSEDRPVAARRLPLLTLHETGVLKVKEVSKVGAFLDWGLEKDLFLPYHEQPKTRVRAGDEVLVSVYLDKSGRLCATMNVYPYLRTDSPYHTGDEVDGRVYETGGNFGVFVAVDDRYSALIPKKEVIRPFTVGELIRARVTAVRPDGKLNLSVRDKSWIQLDADTERLSEILRENGGFLPLDDHSDPEEVRAKVQMSKNEFKRAAGRLFKERRIEFRDGGIALCGTARADGRTEEEKAEK